jgi:hypothetical protein
MQALQLHSAGCLPTSCFKRRSVTRNSVFSCNVRSSSNQAHLSQSLPSLAAVQRQQTPWHSSRAVISCRATDDEKVSSIVPTITDPHKASLHHRTMERGFCCTCAIGQCWYVATSLTGVVSACTWSQCKPSHLDVLLTASSCPGE